MMKKIGCFQKQGSVFVGSIALLHLHVQAVIAPVAEKPSKKSHDFLITQKTSEGFAPELGIAWLKHSRNEGTPYLAVKIDDPLCPIPIHACLWENTDDGLFYLYWDRDATHGNPPEDLLVQEELKAGLSVLRPFQQMTMARIHQLIPSLEAG